MQPKPKHLTTTYSTQFKERSIVAAYQYRPPYPAEVFTTLADLITEEPHTVLDVGCGTGDIARHLAAQVTHVDAVDFSQHMLETARTLAGESRANLTWIEGRVEEVALYPPYALITAGESLHWMEWDIVLPRFQQLLTPHGYLAIVTRETQPTPWDTVLRQIIPKFSTCTDFQPYNLITELTQRKLFQPRGEAHTRSVPFVQSVEEYIESFHSRNGFSREQMSADAADAFDDALRNAISAFAQNGQVTLHISGAIVWGVPANL